MCGAALFFFLLTAPVFAESKIDLSRLDEGKYVCTYKEHYHDGVGESVLTIEKSQQGYLAIWDGIHDTSKVYTDTNFNTRRIEYTSTDSNLTVVRDGQTLNVQGRDDGSELDKNLELDSENWYQVLPFSLIPFSKSDQKKIKFSLFDPFNLKVRNMQIEKKKQETITVLGESYNVVKLAMRMRGVFTAFWKSELWHIQESGIQAKYEGLNVVPKLYKSKIYLKTIEFYPH